VFQEIPVKKLWFNETLIIWVSKTRSVVDGFQCEISQNICIRRWGREKALNIEGMRYSDGVV
jgi:hypothetical protein